MRGRSPPKSLVFVWLLLSVFFLIVVFFIHFFFYLLILRYSLLTFILCSSLQFYFISAWILSNRVFEEIVGESIHQDLVSKSSVILVFLAHRRALTEKVRSIYFHTICQHLFSFLFLFLFYFYFYFYFELSLPLLILHLFSITHSLSSSSSSSSSFSLILPHST